MVGQRKGKNREREKGPLVFIIIWAPELQSLVSYWCPIMQGWEEESQDQGSRLRFHSWVNSSILVSTSSSTTAKAGCIVQRRDVAHSSRILGLRHTGTPHCELSCKHQHFLHRFSVIRPVHWLITLSIKKGNSISFVGGRLWWSNLLITIWCTCIHRSGRLRTHRSIHHSTITYVTWAALIFWRTE